ncbi:hypothetical protein [Candidatus Sodalis pierantonius]|uniref:hypothetical protein n=1 Tax=Candidatus Sodalis pierantonii TaxID=1486991 RepID=UPI0011DE514C|nr:hypothetical protein [Candidatus Sodalis pierantonius]
MGRASQRLGRKRIQESSEFWISGDNWWFKDNRRGLIFQGGLRIGIYADATERIGLHVHCPNRLLHVSLCVKNFAQGYSTQYNPQVVFLGDQHDGFNWCHGAREKKVYWMAVGY